MDLEYQYDTYHPLPTDQCTSDFATLDIDGISIADNLSRQFTMQRYLQHSDPSYFLPSSPCDDNNSTHAYPSVPHNRQGSVDIYTYDALHLAVGYGSPSGSTFDSAYNSSGWSDRTASPWRSPSMSNIGLPSDFRYSECGSHGFSSQTPIPRQDSVIARACVAMHDVQQQADVQPDAAAFHDGSFDCSPYGTFAQEGYQPIEPVDNADALAVYSDVIETHVDASDHIKQEDAEPLAIRPRGPSRGTSRPAVVTASTSSTRAPRRPRSNRPSSSRNVGDLQDGQRATSSTPPGPFPCPLAVYGCQSSFGSKNEWKRHVASQHIRLGFWRCDHCHNGGKINDFNRKDLYIQHLRRMHPQEHGLPVLSAAGTKNNQKSCLNNSDDGVLHEASIRCYIETRSPPEHSCCLFCEDKFHGPGSWEQRQEHVSGHFESMKKERRTAGSPMTWKSDEAVHNWLVATGLVVARGQRWVLADGGRRKSAA